MKHYLSFFLFLTMALGSCRPKEENKTANESEKIEEHHHIETDSIELNNGAKWVVAPKMIKFIRTMESNIDHFEKNKHDEFGELNELGISLKNNVDSLTSNCTMEGKAHDELHKWLVPYMEMVDKLNSSTNVDDSQKVFEEIKNSFSVFNEHFE